MSAPPASAALDVDAMLDDRSTRVVVCCGSGGVGKTTTAAALALRAAERGRAAAVLTIDPARRLAQSMGLAELDNEPRTVAGVDTSAGGSLDAMMLDMKRTFDEVVATHAEPDVAEQITSNPFYEALSTSLSGTQEYMAMEKLAQLRAENRWDLIVVDTPPSRSALDFLDAPERLGSFLDGRMVRVLTAPARKGGRTGLRFVGIGLGLMAGAVRRIIGNELLTDLQTFVAAIESTFGGFRQRAEETYALLQDDSTGFLVVATPEADALREAAFFVDRLATDAMPLRGVVLNRVTQPLVPTLAVEQALTAAELLVERDEHDLTAAALHLHARRVEEADLQRHLLRGFRAGQPEVPTTEVAALADDVHDLDGLRVIGELLAHR